MTAVVVKTDGNMIVQIRGDGAPVQTVETTRNKAYSAVKLTPNGAIDERCAIKARDQLKSSF